ncbi:MAG: hypothetical protein K8R69_02860 [Deltaproteobacteria bacterium]|nr:hypothetical protein [Deltaproteobacteria bacterium]
MRRLISPFLFLVLLLTSFASPSLAVPMAPDQVPETLKSWIDWALHDHETEGCPFLNGAGDQRVCGWSSRLDLGIAEKQGTFSQQWMLYTDDWVPLPGDEKRWPQSVKADGQSVAVVLRDEVPSVFLKKGPHSLVGSYLWDSVPENFQIPPAVGLLKLTLKGEAVNFPQWDENGLLWLEKDSSAEVGEERLDVRVNRLVDDDIPLILTTRISLDASGKAREVLLGQVLPEGFLVMSIDSPLPTRIETNGQIKVQVRAGSWEIEVKARHLGPVKALTLPGGESPLAPEEVWVFQAHNNLRLVSIEGLPSIDPQQTTLPEDWKRLPAYRIRPGETLQLVERRRGDADPAPDQLTLFRRLWLDFDGGGYTFQDNLTGTMNRGYRLEMNAPVQLGRVAIDGQDQFITALEGDKRSGVEIRQGNLQVNADSRWASGIRTIPAIGWNQDFQQVNGELNLPPGWSLLAVNGADEVPGTWISRWNLLNIFMVLILFLIFTKLWGKGWGLLSLFALSLTYTEADAPQWVWLALLAGCALLRLLKPGKLRSLARIYVGIALVVLVGISIPFMVQQLRQGMYPVLEHSYNYFDSQGGNAPYPVASAPAPSGFVVGGAAAPNQMPMPQEANAPEPSTILQDNVDAGRGEGVVMKRKLARRDDAEQREQFATEKPSIEKSLSKSGYDMKTQENLFQQRPGTKVQTGPGLPTWNWNRYDLRWNGPVEKTQTLHLWLLSPSVNLVLSILRVIFLALLVLCVLGMPGAFWPNFLKPKRAMAAALLAALSLALAPGAARAEYPSTDLLNELRERLLQNPECFPDCASVSRMQLNVAGNQLRAQLEIGVEGLTAVPLPGSFEEWSPQTVSVDGQPFSALHRTDEGQLWIQLNPGVHQVMLEGPLPDKPSVQIALPLKPHYLQATVTDWTLEGLQENGLTADNLQLTRLQGLTPDAHAPKESNLPPFFSVERHLILGLTWEVETRVVRLTPPGTAFLTDVSLLPGESVTDADVEVKDGKVSVSMGPNATEFSWHSVLKENDKILLKAPNAENRTEVWRLDLNPIWHLSAAGIPPVHPESAAQRWPQEWRPWPEEEVTLSLSRPAGVPGQTLTIDRSLLVLRPGLRFTESTLSLTLRSSLGVQHVLTLPEGAVLQSVQINGAVQPIRQEGLKVSLPLVPGSQKVELNWQQPLPLKAMFRSPDLKLGTTSVNAEIQVQMPESRWVLATGGLRVGPAVLFWSLLAVVLLVSIGLWASIIVAGWILALGYRERKPIPGKIRFDLFQILLVAWTVAALIVIFSSIHQGLLGMPDMQIAGNGSSHTFLRWFKDRTGDSLPRVWVVSVPLFCYRLAMLAWALWLALALLRWLRWAWASLTSGGAWRSLRAKRVPASSPNPPAV